MITKPIPRLLKTLSKKLKTIAYSFSQRPKAQPAEYELEHILVYHNLNGSTPENQPEFRTVHADIKEAIANSSSNDLGIALKLPPLFWQERLQSIAEQLSEQERVQIIDLLLQDDTPDTVSDTAPLKHSNWRVRANSANILSFLQASRADKSIAQSLHQASDTKSAYAAAFCHLCNALGRLKTPNCKEVLKKYLYASEPWFRVDAANALTCWDQEEIVSDVMQALLSSHLLSDYMAVVIARKIPLAPLLEHTQKVIQSGAHEAIIGVLEASQNTYSYDVLVETSLWNCLPPLFNFNETPTSPRHARAALMLHSSWLNTSHLASNNLQDQIAQLPLQSKLQLLSSSKLQPLLTDTLQNISSLSDKGEGPHAIALIGDLQIQACAKQLVNLLLPESAWLDNVIETVGQLGYLEAAPILIDLANKLVDISYRTSLTLSQQPVVEDALQQSKTYWLILKALGNMPTSASLSFLHKATQDFAADKRQQAFESYFRVARNLKCSPDNIKATVLNGLNDPSSAVKMSAIAAVSDFHLIELLPNILKLSHSRELSLQKLAQQCVRNLGQKGTKVP